MDGGKIASVAAIGFSSVRDAERRVAGVASAARIVRELAQAEFAVAWLTIPEGEAIDAAAMADVHRLAGSMAVRIGEPPDGATIVTVPGNRLIPAQSIAAFVAGQSDAVASAIDLSGSGASMEILRATGKAGDGPVSRWFNRPVSRRLSALLLLVPGMRPIHATAGTVLLALAMFVALVAGGKSGLIAGGLLFHAASVFDGVDGEVARATFRSSHAGAALDSAVDTATTLLFLIGLAINIGESAFVLAGWGLGLFTLGLALLGWRATRAGAALNLDSLKQHYRGRFSGSVAPRLMAYATVVSSRDFFALLFAVLILVGVPMAVLYIFAMAATVWIVFVAGSLLAPAKPGLVPDRG